MSKFNVEMTVKFGDEVVKVELAGINIHDARRMLPIERKEFFVNGIFGKSSQALMTAWNEAIKQKPKERAAK